MYYRRKVLLALIETFGGNLKRIDCQKLLLLFCQHTGQNHYDFFPYRYGGFSFLVYKDKEILEHLGYLTKADDFQVKDNSTQFDGIRAEDQLAMKLLVAKYGNMRGNPLIRQAYLEFPQYTCNSEILTHVLNRQEIETIQRNWNKETSSCIFTIGYEGRTIDSYLNTLIANNIGMLVDVRRVPNSMKYGFSKTRLQSYINKAGIYYRHIPELGIPTNMRQNLDGPEAYKILFRHYEDEILPEQTDALKQIMNLLEEHHRIALTCVEADYSMCHRHKIAEHIARNPEFTAGIKHL